MPVNQIRCLLFVVWVSVQLAFGVELETEPANDQLNSAHSVRAEDALGERTLRLPKQPFRYAVALPQAVQSIAKQFDNQPASNPITDHGATLGRVLFYDPTLSANGTTSCASCHKQEHAFTDDRKLSIGFDGKAVTRNSMSLVNARYYPNGRMFWDERADSLEAQVLMPIENEIEMGHQLPELVSQLQADPIYPPLFASAFDDGKVTKARISKALSQFVRSIVSFRSRYDLGLAQVADPRDPFPNFTDEENLGKQQFFGRALCSTCHLEPHPSELQPIVATDAYDFPDDERTRDLA
ncbi:MAG: cytochrome-c peroxidase, partial [Rubripirellula sp.]